jgi:cytochrome b involved in lipid metabolism
MPNPMQGSGFMKGYVKPNLPPKSLDELLALEEKDDSLPMYTLNELSKHKGGKNKPWVCLKGVIYDVSANDVYD